MNVIGRDTLSNQIEYAHYKIGVQALPNVAKHAGDQTQALITLTKRGGKFSFEVLDNGLGFDEAAVFHGAVSFGFEGMQRWAKSIGAKLDIQSKPAQGTLILVHGPVSE